MALSCLLPNLILHEILVTNSMKSLKLSESWSFKNWSDLSWISCNNIERKECLPQNLSVDSLIDWYDDLSKKIFSLIEILEGMISKYIPFLLVIVNYNLSWIIWELSVSKRYTPLLPLILKPNSTCIGSLEDTVLFSLMMVSKSLYLNFRNCCIFSLFFISSIF